MCPAAEPHPTIDERHFRHIVGHLASGVTVITTADGEGRFGMTASSVTSLSADPALMLACLNNAGPTAAAVARSGRYCVNVLGEQNGGLAKRFAAPSENKFHGIAVSTGLIGVPLLDEALAHIECEVVDRFIQGTHSIFVGRVVAATAQAAAPSPTSVADSAGSPSPRRTPPIAMPVISSYGAVTPRATRLISTCSPKPSQSRHHQRSTR